MGFSGVVTTWRRLGRLTRPNLDDRDVILFPEKINGKFAMLHRPKQWTGAEYGCSQPAIWITFSDDMMVWEEKSHLLMQGRPGTWEEKIGGSTPPLKTKDGWLLIYHEKNIATFCLCIIACFSNAFGTKYCSPSGLYCNRFAYSNPYSGSIVPCPLVANGSAFAYAVE